MTQKQNKLYIDLSQTAEPLVSGAGLAEADGYILTSGELPAGLDIDGKEILLQNVLPQSYPDIAGLVHTRICSSGLEDSARLRDQHPEFDWVPRVDAIHQQTAYHFPESQDSANFRTYQPVFLNQSPYLIDDGAISLTLWLKKAAELGFSSVWLHAPGAANAAMGLDLALREMAVKIWSGNLWLSGGASTIMHIKYLVHEGGVDTLVIPPALAFELGCNEIYASLHKEMAPQQTGMPESAEKSPADLPQDEFQGE
ncbi:hypothetical protein MNBD_ALPHA12-1947 [hydrothermal vent metagenome]|uniref:Uncharacterized protein n=1 Tax=hydrothermal vent metagenome TaxID=652676 RepID=A0A3B0UHD5_9ZZZZ